MKQIIYYLKSHFQAQARILFYLLWLSLLAGLMYGRYRYHWDISFREYPLPFIWGFFYYASVYLLTLLFYALVYQKGDFFREPYFWALSLGILLVPYLNHFADIYNQLAAYFPVYGRDFARKFFFNIQNIVLYLGVPAFFLIWERKGANRSSFYGFTRENFQIAPYLWMLALMLPLLIGVSFREDFLHTYPRYKPGTLEGQSQISPVWTVLLYEASYSIQFIALEIFFRGFIVLSLARFLKEGAVFPMVSLYVLIHFYKPWPETLGSLLGGFSLGVIAYYSRSVWGGMLVHIGIALLMELLAFVQLSGVW